MIVLIMGVSGSGKTTIGAALARELGARFVDADDYHPSANVEKMRRGVPLTEADREPWLAALRVDMDTWLDAQLTVVLACSALTRRSRARLGAERDGIYVVWLQGAPELIAARMQARRHFMPASLLESQLRALEPPEGAIELDVAQTPEALVRAIVGRLPRRA